MFAINILVLHESICKRKHPPHNTVLNWRLIRTVVKGRVNRMSDNLRHSVLHSIYWLAVHRFNGTILDRWNFLSSFLNLSCGKR